MWSYFKKIELERIAASEEKNCRLSILWENDYDVVLAAVKSGYCDFYSIHPKWQVNKEIQLAILNKDPSNVRHMHDLQEDEETICLLIMKDPFVVKYAAKNLRNTPGVMRLAAAKNFTTLQYASKELRDSSEFMLEMISLYGIFAFTNASKRLQNNWQFALEALKKSPKNISCFSSISKKLLMNENFILMAVLVSYDARSWILGRWIHRKSEIPNGLSEKIRYKLVGASKKGIILNEYEALLELANEKEQELMSQKIRVPARIHHAGATYGVLLTSRHAMTENKKLQPLPYIPYEIAFNISQFSPLYSTGAMPQVNRCALASAKKALEKASLTYHVTFRR